MESDLVEAWRRNAAMTLFLLDSLPPKALAAAYSARTRTVAAQFAHCHNVRVYHLEARGRAKGAGLEPFPRGAEPAKAVVRRALLRSEDAVADLLEACEAKGRVPSWKGPVATLLGYFVAHEAHHRGLALASLRLSGFKVPKEVVYGLWEAWGKERSPRKA
jgi:uncharacterized damage-inducible protein DinB